MFVLIFVMSFDHAIPDHWTNSSSSHLARDFRDSISMEVAPRTVFEGSSVRPVGYRGISWDTGMVTHVTLCLEIQPMLLLCVLCQ